ncbi:MAG: cysteine--1-D-myo-inosityl 2-amino-2-deoxy-alpha-D-glucopyranoside ligase [Candidatus Nanopelagicales bacterium]
MHSWSAPGVPALPATDTLPQLRLFDTAAQSVREAGAAAEASMYVCGITPYDATHLGHASTYLAFDLLNRVWRDQGKRVRYAQNVTDVDDPLLERAVERGEDWRELAERETELFRADMSALRVLPPQHYVGAVEAIPAVADRIAQLQDAGAVYAVDADLYFDVSRAVGFGQVSGLSPQVMLELSAARGGDPQRGGKRHPLDCLLWQGARPDEPAWNSPLGHGRPGWHIECVTIALDHLGNTLDVQGGGADLAFPHHEMCAAQASLVTGQPFARHYVHTGMVGYQGEKMSKSLGNLVFVSELLAGGSDASAIRLAVAAHHYRAGWEWEGKELDCAVERLDRWRAAVALPTAPPFEAVLAAVRSRLADDMDSPGALETIDEWANAALADALAGGRGEGAGALAALAADSLLGVVLR